MKKNGDFHINIRYYFYFLKVSCRCFTHFLFTEYYTKILSCTSFVSLTYVNGIQFGAVVFETIGFNKIKKAFLSHKISIVFKVIIGETYCQIGS